MPHKDLEKRKQYGVEYHKKHKDKLNKRSADWRENHKEIKKQYDKVYRKKNQDKIRIYMKKYSKILVQKNKSIVLTHYGGNPPKCACCGETIIEFLSIDHINGGGHQQRKQIRCNFYKWLIKYNFPEGYQVLCHNCNQGRQLNDGICPHKKLNMVFLQQSLYRTNA